MKRIVSVIVIAALLAVSCKKEPAQPAVAVTGVTFSQESLYIEIGEQVALTVTLTPSDASNKNIRFTSSKESVVAVTQDGVVEGVSVGKSIVTATTEDGGFKAHCEVEVSEKITHVTGISFGETSLSLREGEKVELIPTIVPENASIKNVNWASNNEEVAKVSALGVVTALKEGKAIITATTVDREMSATCAIDVETAYLVTTGDCSYRDECSAVISLTPSRDIDTSDPENKIGIEYTTTDFKKDYLTAEARMVMIIGRVAYGECQLKDLLSDQTYYYRAYVISKGERSVGETKTFKTLAIDASVTTLDAIDISYTKASMEAYVNFSPVASYSGQGCFYYSSEYTTPEDLVKKGIRASFEGLKFDRGRYFSYLAESLQSGTKYYYIAAAEILDKTFTGEVKTFTTKTRPAGSVDLGLSVLWANCNVGASSPEQYGRYFAWGDVVGQTWNGSSWSGGGFTTIPEYEVDSKWDKLLPEYDAAHVNLGGDWRMPTAQEVAEFINFTTRTKTTDYNGTGVAGTICTSKVPGYTDKSIFLPAAGYGDGTDAPKNQGIYIYYWSGSLDGNPDYACGLGDSGNSAALLHIGRPIRAVVK